MAVPAAAAAADGPKINAAEFFSTMTTDRFDIPALGSLLNVYILTNDPSLRRPYTRQFVVDHLIYTNPAPDAHSIQFQLDRVLNLVAQMDAVKHDVGRIWDLVQRQAIARKNIGGLGDYVVFLLQAHFFLLPTLTPAQVRQLEVLARERAVALRAQDTAHMNGPEVLQHQWDVDTSNTLLSAWSEMFRATRQQRAWNAARLTDRLTEGAASHLPALPKGVSDHIASFLVPSSFVREPPPPKNAAQTARQAAFERGSNVRREAHEQEEWMANEFNKMVVEEAAAAAGAGAVGDDLASVFAAMRIDQPASTVSARWQNVLQKPFTTSVLEKEVNHLAQMAHQQGLAVVRPLARAFFLAHEPRALSAPGGETCLEAFCDLLAFFAIRADPLAVLKHMQRTATSSFLPAGPENVDWIRMLLFVQVRSILVADRIPDRVFVRQLRDAVVQSLCGFADYASLAAAWPQMAHSEHENLSTYKRIFHRLMPVLRPLFAAAHLQAAEPVHPDAVRVPVYPPRVSQLDVERYWSVINFSDECYRPALRSLARIGLTDPHLLETHVRAFFRRHLRTEADRLDLDAVSRHLCALLRELVFPLYAHRGSPDEAASHVAAACTTIRDVVMAEQAYTFRLRYKALWADLMIHCILLPRFNVHQLRALREAIPRHYDHDLLVARSSQARAMYTGSRQLLQELFAPAFEVLDAAEEGAAAAAAAAEEEEEPHGAGWLVRRRRLEQARAAAAAAAEQQEREKQQRR